MDELKARELVIKAGLELVESGLIARTWGNVSCRLDGGRFVVTPSGRAYESLKPSDLVVCDIADASYTGDVKPSSEKGVHALVYREKKDAGFVIHTHQKWASAVAAAPVSGLDGGEGTGRVPVAAYGLPGTKKLLNGVADVLSAASSCVLMAHHGALCFGADYGAAFSAARALEESCERFIREKYTEKTGNAGDSLDRLPLYNGAPSAEAGAFPATGSGCREEDGFTVTINGEKSLYPLSASKLPKEASLHAAVYRARPDILFIEGSSDDALLAHANARQPIPAMLDDFAQMVGMSVLAADGESGIPRALKGGRAGVLVPGYGALCCAATRDDARAARMIMEKTALASLAARLLGTPKSIPAWECALMRFIYKQSYSKRK